MPTPTAENVYVIVSRPLHPQPDWVEQQLDWRPVVYAESLEEAWAALDLAKEHEREQLHAAGEYPHEREYDVWTVKPMRF